MIWILIIILLLLVTLLFRRELHKMAETQVAKRNSVPFFVRVESGHGNYTSRRARDGLRWAWA